MGAALQAVNFFKQGLAGGGGFESLAPGTGDSATFANVPQDTSAFLADVRGSDDASPCELSLTASRFHDQIEGIAGWVPDGSTLAPPNRASTISPPGFDQPIFPSDILSVRAKGTAGDNVNATLVLYYPNLPGIAGVFRTWEFVRANLVNLVGVDVALDASSPSQGDWSESVALSAAGRRLDAQRYYAVLGFTADVPCTVVALSSFETGNLRVGGPVIGDGDHDANVIANMSRLYQTPLIPVINGSNQDSVLLQCADPAASNVNVTVMLAELQNQG